MSKTSGKPEQKESELEATKCEGERGYSIITKLGSIEGLLDSLLTKSRQNYTESCQKFDETIDTIKRIEIPTMAAKNNLEFKGRGNESAQELIDQLKVLKLANGWDDKKMVGQALATMKDEAKAWYEQVGINAFCAEGSNDPTFAIFETKFLDKFKADINQSDLLYDMLNCKQTRGQSVDEYLPTLCTTLTKLKDVKEEVKCGMIINGFVPYIRDNLKLKEVRTMKDLELWAYMIYFKTIVCW